MYKESHHLLDQMKERYPTLVCSVKEQLTSDAQSASNKEKSKPQTKVLSVNDQQRLKAFVSSMRKELNQANMTI
jgi:5,10-methylene-tetrahydrofolate dehydrogenase/methenyl tetrahydrofolate cyclohydrolase